jgi:inosose dehydratase
VIPDPDPATVRLAASPVSWGIDFADHPDNPPWRVVLDEIGASGCGWTELGPVGYLPERPERLRSELERRSLRVPGSWLVQPLSNAARTSEVTTAARRTCELIAAARGRFLVVIDTVRGERDMTAGRSADARRLGPEEWRAFAGTLRSVLEVARGFELEVVFHPHSGSHVEFPDEIERLLEEFPAGELNLCLDTGHMAFSGADPVALYRELAARVRYLHLKDVDPRVLRTVKEARRRFWAAVGEGVFCPLGSGAVDFEGFRKALDDTGFDGFATVEQDRDPRSGRAAAEDLRRSLDYLTSVGFVNTRSPRD